MKKTKLLLLPVSVPLIGTAAEILIQLNAKPAQKLPSDEDYDYYYGSAGKIEDLYLFLTGKSRESFTEEEIYNILSVHTDYMSHRFDCSDFRAQLLFKLYKDCPERLSERCRKLIKNTFICFKYFMDEPGDDSMCYWSENHQILFAVSEYLAGQEWPDEIFTNSGLTGEEHRIKALVRIRAWIIQRFNYGFSEYLSNNYLAEDLAPMANFIAYARDYRDVENMKTVMNLLWLDVALNSVNNRFLAVSSRMYGNNKAGNCYGNSIQAAMNILWGKELAEGLLKDKDFPENEKEQLNVSLEKRPNSILLCFTDIVEKGIYVIPGAVRDIALSRETFTVKMGCGLSPDDLVHEGLVGQEPYQIMAQLGAETFTNPQVILNTIRYFKTNKMLNNAFVKYFRFFDVSFLRLINPERFASKYNLMPHGIALGRGNIYTFRTPYYTLSTTVAGSVDVCGAQEQVWSANISGKLALFSTHPSGNGENRYCSSPGYWTGNGRRPMSVQYERVNITIYRLPRRKRLAETGICRITHFYMPREFYDEFELYENCVFARMGKVFICIRSNGKLGFRPYNVESLKGIIGDTNKSGLSAEYIPKEEFDLCQFGGDCHAYVTELSDCSFESFTDFKERMKHNRTDFKADEVAYSTYFGDVSVSFGGKFIINGISQETEYARYDCRFCKAERKAEKIVVDSEKNVLTLRLLS